MLSMHGKKKLLNDTNELAQVPNLECYNDDLIEMLHNVENMEMKSLSLSELSLRREHHYENLNTPFGNLGEVHPIGKRILNIIDDAIGKKVTDILATSIENGLISLEESETYRTERKLVLLEELNNRKEQ